MAKLVLVLKDKVEKWIDKRNGEIEASADSKTVVDIGLSFDKMFCRVITHICFGEDISASEIEIECISDPKGYTYNRKKLCLPEALREVND